MTHDIITNLEVTRHIRLLGSSPNIYAWDFIQGPYGPSRSYVLRSTEKGPVGCTSFRPTDIKLGEVIYPASLNHGTKLDVDYPNFLKETKQPEWNAQAVVSLAVPKNMSAQYVKAGWLHLGDAIILAKAECVDKGFSCLAVPQLTQEIDKFSLEVVKKFSFAIIKGSTILNWRTGGPRRYVHYLLRPGEFRGYMIMTYWDYDAHIVDFKAKSQADLEEMLLSAESFAAGKRSLKVWSNFKDPFQEVFLAHGFEKTQVIKSLFLRLNEDSSNISLATSLFKGNWMISGIDLEMM